MKLPGKEADEPVHSATPTYNNAVNQQEQQEQPQQLHTQPQSHSSSSSTRTSMYQLDTTQVNNAAHPPMQQYPAYNQFQTDQNNIPQKNESFVVNNNDTRNSNKIQIPNTYPDNNNTNPLYEAHQGLSSSRYHIPIPLSINQMPTSVPTPALAPPSSEPLAIASLPYTVRKYLANMAALKFYDLVDFINLSAGKITEAEYWQTCIDDIFTSDAILRYSKTSATEVRQFDFLVPLIPILFVTLGRLGVIRIEVIVQQLKTELISNGSVFFNCPKCTFTYHYPDGSYITHFIQIKGLFNSQLKIEWGDLCMHSFIPGVEWNSLEKLVGNNLISLDLLKKLSNKEEPSVKSEEHDSNINDPKYETNPLPPNFEAITQLRSYFSVFRNVSVFGSQEGLMRVMQVSTVMSSLKNLRMYQKLHNIESPLEGLNKFVETYKSRIPQNNINIQHPQGIIPSHINVTDMNNLKSQTMKRNKSAINNKNYNKSVSPATSAVSPFSHENKVLRHSSQKSDIKLPSSKRRQISCVSPHSTNDQLPPSSKDD